MRDLLTALIGVVTPTTIVLAVVYQRYRKATTNELESFSRYVTQGVKYYIARVLHQQFAAELTLRQYARLSLQSTAVQMAVPARYPVHLRVDDVFVPLLLRGAIGPTSDYQNLTARHGARVAVVGEPGSGKSSLMKRVFRDACRKANAQPRRAQLPILFELRDLRRLSNQDLERLDHERLFELCTRSVLDANVYRPADALTHLAHGEGYLLLLDGLDEVPSDAAEHVAETIVALSEMLAKRAPKSSILVSTRTQHYFALAPRRFKDSFESRLIRPFSPADVYRFLSNWPYTRNRKQNVTRLFLRIRNLPSLADMCTNPLALAMFVARDQQTDGAQAPETRSAFYDALVEELLVFRRARSSESKTGRQRLLRRRESILGTVCLEHLLDPDEAPNSIPGDRFLRAVQAEGQSADEAMAALTNLAVDTGLFSEEREGESYRFLHLTLCEFLAAKEIVNRGEDGWTLVHARLSRYEDDGIGPHGWASRLAEVTAFACGLAPRAMSETIIHDLAQNDEPLLLLRAIIEAQAYDNREAVEATVAIGDLLAKHDPSKWDPAWFSLLRRLIAVLRDVNAGVEQGIRDVAPARLASPAEYLIALIDEHGAEEQLLATLARLDADAAISIAESTARPELMDVIAGNADEFSVLLGLLSRHESGHRSWSHALVRAALRQSTIAEVLAARPEQRGARATNARGWIDAPPLAGSTYGRLVDDVLATPAAWRTEDQPYLQPLAAVRPSRWALNVTPQHILRDIFGIGVAIALLVSALGRIGEPLSEIPFIPELPYPTAAQVFTTSLLFVWILIRLVVILRRIRASAPSRAKPRTTATADNDAELFVRLEELEADASERRKNASGPPSRRRVLNEIFNLAPTGSVLLFKEDPESDRPSVPDTAQRLATGTRKTDFEALIALRRLRASEEVSAS